MNATTTTTSSTTTDAHQGNAHQGNRVFRAAPRRRGRVRALLAGGLVLGVGSAATLAAWTDTEWVYGDGSGDRAGVAASVFEVQQNVWDGLGGVANFVDRESQAEAGGLLFSPLAATSLSPGDTVFAPMQLRTAPGSVAAVDVTVNPAVKVDGDDDFFTALRYSVRSGVAKGACGPAAFPSSTGTGTGTELARDSALTTGSGAKTFTLGAATEDDGGQPEDLCFAITLPGGSPDALQGKSAAPAWSFTSTSG